jgi:CO/xanthine dehydrogenase Mo-binding subunit
MTPSIAALGNAIYDATGIRLEGPPFLPEKVYLAMKDAGILD